MTVPEPRPLDVSTQPRRRARPTSAAPALDDQIALLEQRLVAREAWVRSTALSLGQRTQQAVTPASWLLPALGGVAVLWLGWRWSRRRAPAARPSDALPAAAPARGSEGVAAVPWAGLVSLGWPLLPPVWRGRVSPAAATAAVSTAILIARRLFGRRAR